MSATRVVPVRADEPEPSVIAEAAAILRSGGLVAFATETVYGLGADATDSKAVARIFEAKGRPSTNPLIVHVESKEAALACVSDWPIRADLLADRFWPGPLTLVLPRSSIIPDIVTACQETVGVRVPRPQVARRLILETGRPIAAPSANRSLGLSPTMASHVVKDLDGKVDLILDSGRTTLGIESTVLDLAADRPRVLRPGRITAEQIAEVLGEPVEASGGPSEGLRPVRSPGQLAVHYSPKTPAYRLGPDQIPPDWTEFDDMTLIIGDHADQWPLLPDQMEQFHFRRLADPEEAAALFYSQLHELDALGLDFILIIPPPDEPQWRAIRDRIWRATRPWPGVT